MNQLHLSGDVKIINPPLFCKTPVGKKCVIDLQYTKDEFPPGIPAYKHTFFPLKFLYIHMCHRKSIYVFTDIN